MPQETVDTEAFFKSLEKGLAHDPDGRITFEGGSDDDCATFMRQWLVLTGQDPDDYEP